jgi:hypothetical protein
MFVSVCNDDCCCPQLVLFEDEQLTDIMVVRNEEQTLLHEICISEVLIFFLSLSSISVADTDPGSAAFLPPGSGIWIGDEFFLDPGSRGYVFW